MNITFQLLAGDLRIGCPSVNDDVIRDAVSTSPVTVESFQPLPTSCIAFAASLTMTCKKHKFVVFILHEDALHAQQQLSKSFKNSSLHLFMRMNLIIFQRLSWEKNKR